VVKVKLVLFFTVFIGLCVADVLEEPCLVLVLSIRRKAEARSLKCWEYRNLAACRAGI
jgi:hypothetical protein